MLFKKFYNWLIIGLMKDMTELMNQLSLNTLTFRLIDRYQEVLYMSLPAELRSPRKGLIYQKQRSKMFFMVSC